MKVKVLENAEALGAAAAKQAAERLQRAIREKGHARLLLSTGASQFTFFQHFTKEAVDWDKVEMFHLDEYVGISPTHPASFQLYLRQRFVDVVHPGKYHLIDGRADPEATIAALTDALSEGQIDLGLIGIGENGHIAFNDPPADFSDSRCYKIVTLSDTCLNQQLREGWFESKEAAFKQAISMTCQKIMDCATIICAVPYTVKAEAIRNTLTSPLTEEVPATLLKEHPDVTLYCDRDSASLTDAKTLAAFA
ncbi:MAG: glucosamine-6-phosphate deaminase [Ruminococcaceae bacterium]|nr:glucosamine-6-phosphate deaminase [Oscillospiraceae bacterium]